MIWDGMPLDGYWEVRRNIFTKSRTAFQQFYWSFMTSVTVDVPWPIGPVAGNEDTISADPNDHYRGWLEENVGKQGWDWQWEVVFSILEGKPKDGVRIMLRHRKAQYATMIKLMWGANA